jgi:hypothetical protein
MKRILLSLVLLATISYQPSTCLGQGSLTPPGTPAPTMKSLDQIASTGIAINATNTPGDSGDVFVISQTGNYYMTGNIAAASGKNGIKINASGTTIDMNGFQISGAGSGGGSAGILILAGSQCCVKNGSITNIGTGTNSDGIRSLGSNNQIDSSVTIANHGYGIHTGATDPEIRNIATGNMGTGANANYSPASGSLFGPLGSPGTATSPWANF